MAFGSSNIYGKLKEKTIASMPCRHLSIIAFICCLDALSKVPRRDRRPLKTDSQGKYLSRSLRLDNNHITEVSNLQCVLSHFLVQPSSIGWLDLSFNKITSISAVRLSVILNFCFYCFKLHLFTVVL